MVPTKGAIAARVRPNAKYKAQTPNNKNHLAELGESATGNLLMLEVRFIRQTSHVALQWVGLLISRGNISEVQVRIQ